MVVYVDVLIIVNLIINYFLLLATSRILGKRPKVYRMLLSALLGSVGSLYIFLPQMAVVFELIFKVCLCFLCVLVAFGFKSSKNFLKSGGVFFLITCAFGGIMTAVFKIFKPDGMAVYNSVVYFNLSPLLLVALTVGFYLLFCLCRFIFSRHAQKAERCSGKIFADGKATSFTAIVDTGNSLLDVFGKSEIIVVERRCAEQLFGETDINLNRAIKGRYRPIPLCTVTGTEILDGFRCDSAEIDADGNFIRLEKPIIAISKHRLGDDYNAILNPQTIA